MIHAMHPNAADWARRAMEAFGSAITRGEADEWSEFVVWHANYDLAKELADIGVPDGDIESSMASIFEMEIPASYLSSEVPS